MTLSFSKFLLGVTEGRYGDEPEPDIRCSLCGHAEKVYRLDDAVEFAEQHECAPLRVTSSPSGTTP